MIATPLGNLGDITARAVASLKAADLVACEDTRRTRILLSHLSISRPTRSLHRFNEAVRLQPLLAMMREGRTVALVSDAGTPGVSDPGARLVFAARAEGIHVEAIPGPSAPAAAVSVSGMESGGFVFAGYPPSRGSARRRFLAGLVAMERARTEADSGAEGWPIVLFEAPHRIADTLRDMSGVFGDRSMILFREMTKLHEEAITGKISEVATRLGTSLPRGEMTLVIAPGASEAGESPGLPDLREAYRALIESGLGRKEALKRLAVRWKKPKREIYSSLLSGDVSGEEDEPSGS